MTSILNKLAFHNSFSSLDDVFFSWVKPQGLWGVRLAHANPEAAQLIGLSQQDLETDEFLQIFSGNQVPAAFAPLAMAYSGHQFGVYNPQLGDGRGLLLAEARPANSESAAPFWDIHLKGAGRTPYSRFGDGRAVLRSSIREYLGSEALFHLGVPSTRALALFASKEPVQRETEETGALLVRMSQSHVRFGSFEFFHYTRQPEKVKQLADYVIDKHHPDLPDDDSRYPLFLQRVVLATAELIAHWQTIGFTHGVMNTDNMSIIGETFDYGPYGFLDDYIPNFVCNHSDHQGRYAYDQQPGIGLWNLNALAHGLSTLIDTDDIKHALSLYEPHIRDCFATKTRAKLGLTTEEEDDVVLATGWLQLLQDERADYTRSYRALSHFSLTGDNSALRDQFVDRDSLDQWLLLYSKRLEREGSVDENRRSLMCANNPKYILRNYLAQKAIEAAEQDNDFSEVDRLLTLLKKPYDEQPEFEAYAAAPPESAKGLELSCSS
ncbi:YdiU family protein [Aestuariicella sp. G3-2]|uniref:protein adenylyltransferase SelO n=1 Tax=Pseudomaricurvus albidus TaxID=2842452 RepID=UPI001C0B5742|nr:YdiU family protein [Aestuariicella albida]MBU3070115.1 YdiU family protein [Aestuariicella albida]